MQHVFAPNCLSCPTTLVVRFLHKPDVCGGPPPGQALQKKEGKDVGGRQRRVNSDGVYGSKSVCMGVGLVGWGPAMVPGP